MLIEVTDESPRRTLVPTAAHFIDLEHTLYAISSHQTISINILHNFSNFLIGGGKFIS